MTDQATIQPEAPAQGCAGDPLQTARKQAAALLGVGLTPEEVKTHLENQGLDPEEVAKVVKKCLGVKMLQRPAETSNGSGKRKMIWGGLWFLGGVAVSIITYLISAPGATFVVAYGAILYGGWRFIQGLKENF